MAQEIDFPKQDPDQVSPLNLAFIGDSVYEVLIRNHVLAVYNGSVKEVNLRTETYTRASGQSRMILLLTDSLTEEELRIYKRGRNVKSLSAPKSCSISEYRHATGLEALVGYLFLKGSYERLVELVHTGIGLMEKEADGESNERE